MAITKKTETAVKKAEPAVKAEETKAVKTEAVAEKKPAEKKTVKAAEKKPAAKKTAAKKPAEKKPAVKKAAAPKAAAVKVILEYQGVQLSQEDIVAAVMAKAGKAKTVEIYVKPEDHAAYYVADGESGKVEF